MAARFFLGVAFKYGTPIVKGATKKFNNLISIFCKKKSNTNRQVNKTKHIHNEKS